MEIKLKEKAREPAVTRDGRRISVKGNLIQGSVKTVLDHGRRGHRALPDGVLYLVRKDIPTEEDHFEAYRSVVEAVSPYNTVIRTLDLGGDKFYSALNMIFNERNPVMGLRPYACA
jgi:phosphotransferase system enzyme I (PtsI)